MPLSGMRGVKGVRGHETQPGTGYSRGGASIEEHQSNKGQQWHKKHCLRLTWYRCICGKISYLSTKISKAFLISLFLYSVCCYVYLPRNCLLS